MAKPNYGFQKRQKQIAKQKKKEAKMKRKLEGSSGIGEEPDSLDTDQTLHVAQKVQEVKQKLADLPMESSLYAMGEELLLNLNSLEPEEAIEMADGFLERVTQQQQT